MPELGSAPEGFRPPELASEYAKEVVEDSFRIRGGSGFSKEYQTA
jgi:hypothetical protein